jgi:phosphoribosylformylglycinamidine cyclo-ligase
MSKRHSERVTGYREAGVDYDTLDAGKRSAMARALATSPLLAAAGGRALDASRGEPAFAFELDGHTFAFVVEGLGTKSIIARHVFEELGVNHFGDVAYDAVAAILNDLCCIGALPLVVNAYFATGASEWYEDEQRSQALLAGWQRACTDAGCAWGGGESPSLPGLVHEREIELAGAAIGVLPDGSEPLLAERLAPGDEIVIVSSSGLHANGASLARLLADRLPDGYATKLPSGASFGEALLVPSVMYVPLVRALLARELAPSYISHITGHGLLKLMRPARELTDRIHSLPAVPEVLQYMTERSGMNAREAHATFNMGSGYAIYAPAPTADLIVALAGEFGFEAILAGQVEAGPRQVIVEPLALRYDTNDFGLAG